MTEETGADVSPEPDEEPIEADVEIEEPEALEENEDDSPSSDEEDVEEKTEDDNPFQKRIDKLTENYRSTERALTALEQENQQLRQQLETIPVPEPEVKTLADFDYDERAYQAHFLGEARRIAREEASGLFRQGQDRVGVDEVVQAHQKREADFSKEVPDYREKVHNDSLRISQPMAEIIRNSDVGPQLAYLLANNPDESARISRLSPAMAGVELSDMLGKIRSEKGKVKNLVSDAPPPPKKIRGVDAGLKVSTVDPKSDKMSDKEWYRREEIRLAKSRG